MRRKSRTIVRANEVPGSFLEFIVRAPLRKREPCHTPVIIRNRSRSVDAGAPPNTTPFRSFPKIVGKHEPTSKAEKPKMARNSDCSRYHLFDMFRALVA
jgi:hypothetical protein